jgi:hypothetical protein
MAEVVPLPNGQALTGADSDKLHRRGDVFIDVRGGDRGMRVSYHQDAGVLVISLWSGRTCRATFQLAGAEAGRLSALLGEISAPGESPPSALAS